MLISPEVAVVLAQRSMSGTTGEHGEMTRPLEAPFKTCGM
jgi:hypothetical protein